MFSLAISNYDSSVYVKCDRIHPTTGLELTNNMSNNTHTTTTNNNNNSNPMLTDNNALNVIPIISNIVYGSTTSLIKSSASSTMSLPIPITSSFTTHTPTTTTHTSVVQPLIEERSFFSTPEYARHTSSSTSSSVSVSAPNHLAPMAGYGSSMHSSHMIGQQVPPTNPHMLSPLHMLARQPIGSTTATYNTNQNSPTNPSYSSNSNIHSHSLSHPSSIFNSTGLSFPDLSCLDLSHTPLTTMSNPMSTHNSSTSLHSSTHPNHPSHLLHQHPLQQQQQQAHNNILIPATNSDSFDSIRLKLAQEIYIFIVQNSKSQGKKIW